MQEIPAYLYFFKTFLNPECKLATIKVCLVDGIVIKDRVLSSYYVLLCLLLQNRVESFQKNNTFLFLISIFAIYCKSEGK